MKRASDLSPLLRPILFASLAFGILGFVLPIYSKQLGASALEIGGLFSVFSIMTVILRPMVGWALDRFGRKRFFIVALVCYASAMVLFSAAGDLLGLYAARLAQGIASSFMWISAYTIATDLAPFEERGSAVGRGCSVGAFAPKVISIFHRSRVQFVAGVRNAAMLSNIRTLNLRTLSEINLNLNKNRSRKCNGANNPSGIAIVGMSSRA